MSTAYHAKYYANALTLRRGGDGVDKLSRSLFDATVDLNPHQIDAALFALKNPTSKGVILADEVGLGKTIEAGLLLCQLWAEGKRRLIVVCPASLRKQWALELQDKFNLPSRVLEARSYNQLKNQGRINPFDTKDEIIITSYHFAARLADEIFPVVWDLVVMDEAHKLRNVYKKDNKIGKALKGAFSGRRKALLTATPLQNSLLEIYGLTLLIDDHLFGDLSAFRAQYVNSGDNLNVLAGRLQKFSLRTLRKDVLEYIPYTNRKALTFPFEPSDAEIRLYDAVTSFMERDQSIALPAQQRQLTTLIMRKLLASSSTAIEGTLRTIYKRLDDIRSGIATAESLLETLISSDDLEDDYLDEGAEDSQAEPVDSDLLDEELAEISELTALAASIKTDEKTLALVIALEKGFAEMAKTGAAKKALIFTESRRTQVYLKEYLAAHGYADKIVTFAGTNTDDTCKAIYEKWSAENKNTGRVTGSRPVDIRTALVDRFQEDSAEIMIATEAAAEGINLQFCSLVINYDLPWNPQRIEQRIGRCHRYGQKHDVVVINFLNELNAADQRVFELLNEKFQLFEGVFGASDEVLGTIEFGVDFEKQIQTIYETCRKPEEIKAAFDALRDKMSESIDTRMADTKLALFAHFDEDVHTKLKMRLDDAKSALDTTGKMFWATTKHILENKARFDDDDLSFDLKSSPLPTVDKGVYHLISKTRENTLGKFLYRLSHPLGEHVLEQALIADTPIGHVEFSIADHPVKISLIEQLQDKSGWLRLHKVTLAGFEEEQFLVFTAMDNQQQAVSQEVCEKLMLVGGRWRGNNKDTHDLLDDILIERQTRAIDAVIAEAMERNNHHLNEERERLEAWADDKVLGAEKELGDTKKQIKVLTREARMTPTPEEQAVVQVRIRELEKKKRRLRQRIFDVEDEIMEERDRLIEELEGRLSSEVTTEELFTIKWSVV